MGASNRHGQISLVIPTLNEEGNIGKLLVSVKKFIKNRRYEIIVVDGNSVDNTVSIAKQHGARILLDDVGKGSALVKGLNAAKGDIVVSMDADLSHQPRELGLLISSVENGYDICMGSRFIEGGKTEDMSLLRFVGNKFFLALVNLRFGSHYTDMCYGYRSFKRKVIRQLDLKEKGFGIETEINIRAIKNNLRILEIPSTEKKRNAGQSKLRTFMDGYSIFKTIIKNIL